MHQVVVCRYWCGSVGLNITICKVQMFTGAERLRNVSGEWSNSSPGIHQMTTEDWGQPLPAGSIMKVPALFSIV